MKLTVSDIESNITGFTRLAELAQRLESSFMQTIEMNFADCQWFDPKMVAAFGAILTSTKNQLNSVEVRGLSSSVQATLLSNGIFLNDGGQKTCSDCPNIPYKQFAPNSSHDFAYYLAKHLREKLLPVSAALYDKAKNCIIELFVNAAQQSETDSGIFACGQRLASAHRVDFSVVDAGIGIRKKIAKELGLKLNSDQAIAWAVREGNTTRTGKIPGGLGLQMIKEFVLENSGRLQIVSDRGIWQAGPADESLMRLDTPYPGTTINIEMSTAVHKPEEMSGSVESNDRIGNHG